MKNKAGLKKKNLQRAVKCHYSKYTGLERWQGPRDGRAGKGIVTKPNALSLVPRTHMQKEEASS